MQVCIVLRAYIDDQALAGDGKRKALVLEEEIGDINDMDE